MSIARITMMEYLSEKDVVASENFYQTIQKDWFGKCAGYYKCAHRSDVSFVFSCLL